MFFVDLIEGYGNVLHYVALATIYTLELIGILIIVLGSAKAIVMSLSKLKKNQPVNVVISLGKALALALEFKMGAEIINTVIVRDLRELGVLAVVIAIRALLALLIHWEIKLEKREEKAHEEKNDRDGE